MIMSIENPNWNSYIIFWNHSNLLDSYPFLYIIYIYSSPLPPWNLSPFTVHITGERCHVSTDCLLGFFLAVDRNAVFFIQKQTEETCTLFCTLSYICRLVTLATVPAQKYKFFCLLNTRKKNKRNLSFYSCFFMDYFHLHMCASSKPMPRLLNRMPFCIYSLRLITCSFEYFPLITLFFHHAVSASSALLILPVCIRVSSHIYSWLVHLHIFFV